MKYSYKQVKDSYPKTHIESIWSKYIPRQLAFPIAFVLVNIGCSAWLVSVISIVVAICACVLIAVPSVVCHWVGIVLIVLWQVLDCVDGTIARTTKKASALGEFIDAQSGYTIMAFIYLSLGIAAFYDLKFIPVNLSYFSIIIGGVSSISNILARLINSKFVYCSLKFELKKGTVGEISNGDDMPTNFWGKLRVLADFHLGLIGVFVPLVIISEIFHLYELLNIAYCIYSLVGLAFATVYYAHKAK